MIPIRGLSTQPGRRFFFFFENKKKRMKDEKKLLFLFHFKIPFQTERSL